MSAHRSESSSDHDDGASEIGENLFATRAAAPGNGGSGAATGGSSGAAARGSSGVTGARAVERGVPASIGRGWGKGPVPVDNRKFRYDVLRGRSSAPLTFTATKVDRLDATVAGDYLHRIHKVYGIHAEEEARILAFDKALWFEHTVNGASMLQPGRGVLTVDGVEFDIAPVKKLLGVDQRRFFRAYADDIAEVNREVLDAYDPYDAVAAEKAAQIHQVAVERGLQKFPHLAHDSSDACLSLSYDERLAVIASKRVVIPSTVNAVDRIAERVSRSDGTESGVSSN